MNQPIHDESICLSGDFYNGSYVGSGFCEYDLSFLSLDPGFYCVFYYFSCFGFYFYSCSYSYFGPGFQIDDHESFCEDSLYTDNDDILNALYLIDDDQIGWEEDYSEYELSCCGKHAHEEWDEEHEDACFAVCHIRGKKDRRVDFEVVREVDGL